LVSSARRIAIASLFGVLIWVVLGFLPAPTADFLIGVEALFLSLSFLVVGRGGATYVGAVSGLLITSVKLSFFPLDLVLAILYGIMVDGLATAFQAKKDGLAKTPRLVGAVTISTAAVGLLAYFLYLTFYSPAQTTTPIGAEATFGIYVSILLFGVLSGAVAGYAASVLWNRNLKSRF
jgi:hypothetical protein